MGQLRVGLREFTLTREIRGVEITKPTGLMYVDVFFPDGTQRVCGYIGKECNGPFAPLCGISPELAEIIQAKINEISGYSEGDGPSPPEVIASTKAKHERARRETEGG